MGFLLTQFGSMVNHRHAHSILSHAHVSGNGRTVVGSVNLNRP